MLRTLHARPSSLPKPLSSFIGREDEIRAVCELFLSGARLVTLTGPGGVGKTRLALAVAEKLASASDGELTFVSLAPIVDYELVIPTVARALGVEESTDTRILDRLIKYLQDRRAAIVLDNVEHVLDAAPDVAQLLQACPELIVLATGREALKLQGEHEYAVRPLAVPSVRNGAAEPGEPESAAVQLFVERARQLSHEFVLTDESRAAIEEICRRLDGVPLALELAAARLKVFSPDELLCRLDQPLAILTGGSRDLPDRQQTMRATLQWSYDLLTPDEQSLFRHLSVFAGGASLDAIEVVSPGAPVVETLGSLVEKNLVRLRNGQHIHTRYDMLEPVRQFALDRLQRDDGEEQAVRQRHFEYYLALVDNLHDRLDAPGGVELTTLVDTEHDNLRSALRWLEHTNKVELGLRLTRELDMFWTQRGYINEGLRWTETFLGAASSSPPSVSQAYVLCGASWLHSMQRNDVLALQLAEEACSVVNQLDADAHLAGQALLTRGIRLISAEDFDRARQDLEAAIPLMQAAGRLAQEVRTMAQLAYLAFRNEDVLRAEQLLEDALGLARERQAIVAEGLVLGFLGGLAEHAGQLDRAAELYVERLRVYSSLQTYRGIAESLSEIGRLARLRGDLYDAVVLQSSALAPRRRSQVKPGKAIIDGDPEVELDILKGIQPRSDFHAANQAGLAMNLQESIDLALEVAARTEKNRESKRPDGLTPREVEVLVLMASGKSNSEMADQLYLSIRTVERHVSNIYRKIDAHNRTDATRYAVQHNIIDLANT